MSGYDDAGQPIRPVFTRCGHWDWRHGRGYHCDMTTLDPDMDGYIGGRFYCPDHRQDARRGQLLSDPKKIARLLHDILSTGGQP